MKINKEVWIMLGILAVAGVLFYGGVLPTLTEQRTRVQKGDPKDVTEDVKKTLIIGSGRPERGAANARFTLVEFGDYQCTTCRRSVAIVDEIMKSHPDLRFIFRHAPLATGHQIPRAASPAAEAARLQNKYW